VDYGNQEEVALSSLRPLDPRFVHLPCQAIKCSLKIKPFVEISSPELKGSGIPQWPKHTKKWFKSILVGRQVTAMFLSTNTSNHAQVDIAISREMLLSSLSCLHGVLSIAKGIRQFLESSCFVPLFSVSRFMCEVKLAVFNGDKWLVNHLFCGPSAFRFPAPGRIFMNPFSGMSPQHSMFPIVKYCNPPLSLPAAFSPGFIQPVISPTSSLDTSDETNPAGQPRSHSEKPTTAQKSVSKKRKASLSGAGDLTLPDLPVSLESVDYGIKTTKSKLEDRASPRSEVSTDDASLLAPVTSLSLNDSLSMSVLDVTTAGLECNRSSLISGSSKSSAPSSPSSVGLCKSNPISSTVVSALTQSVSSSPLSRNDSISSLPTSNVHYDSENSVKASSPLSTIDIALKSPECSKSTSKAISRDDCIKFHTIAALPILSSVISNDSDHYSVIVSHVISPSEFYLNFASDAEEVKNFDSFQQSLHDYYSTGNENKTEEDLSTNLSVGVICSAKYTDGTWNRGIIRDIQSTLSKDGDEEKSKYLIQYIDYGNYHWMPIENIRSLQEEFLCQPALTIRCSLLGVVPSCDRRWWRRKINLSSKVLMTAAGSEDDFQELDQESEELFIDNDQGVFESAKESNDPHHGVKEWPQEATKRFIQLTSDKVLVAVLNEEGNVVLVII